MNIKQMMADDEALVVDIDKGLVKNQNMLKQTMTKIDSVITSASNNVLCYILLFFIMVLGLLYKLTK
jgi:t-SNARE complex subunit (syntaxin)